MPCSLVSAKCLPVLLQSICVAHAKCLICSRSISRCLCKWAVFFLGCMYACIHCLLIKCFLVIWRRPVFICSTINNRKSKWVWFFSVEKFLMNRFHYSASQTAKRLLRLPHACPEKLSCFHLWFCAWPWTIHGSASTRGAYCWPNQPRMKGKLLHSEQWLTV